MGHIKTKNKNLEFSFKKVETKNNKFGDINNEKFKINNKIK